MLLFNGRHPAPSLDHLILQKRVDIIINALVLRRDLRIAAHVDSLVHAMALAFGYLFFEKGAVVVNDHRDAPSPLALDN